MLEPTNLQEAEYRRQSPEGVQAHTETLWHALRALRIPTLLFVNKLDRFGADPGRVLAQIRARLTDRYVPLQALPPAEQAFQAITPLSDALLMEQLAELGDDAALAACLEGRAGCARRRLAALTRECQAFPVLYGASMKGIGIAHLLDAAVDLPALTAGDIAVVSGLGQIRAGDVLGDPARVPPGLRLAVPVLQVRVRPGQPQELPRLLAALDELTDEDPQLQVQWLADLRELHVTVMGRVQVEILESLLRERFKLAARFDPPSVIYRETPVGTGSGQARLWLKGKADVSFRLEPGPPQRPDRRAGDPVAPARRVPAGARRGLGGADQSRGQPPGPLPVPAQPAGGADGLGCSQRRRRHLAWRLLIALYLPAALPQVSFSVIVRLKTRVSAVESGSTQK